MFEREPIKINPEAEKKELIGKIDSFLNDFTNDIPEELVKLDDPNYYKYKVRVNWFQGVSYILESATNKQLISEGLKNEVAVFFDNFKERHAVKDVRTTKEEIEKAENLLKKVKDELCEGK